MKCFADAYRLAQGYAPRMIAQVRGVTSRVVRANRVRYEKRTGHKLPRFRAGRPRKVDPRQLYLFA